MEDLIKLEGISQNTKETPTKSTKDGQIGTRTNNSSMRTKNSLNDPNSINVEIGDSKAPIVLLFGPKDCGKSMALIRLARFLKKHEYAITLDRNFRTGDEYSQKCDSFNKYLNTEKAVPSTDLTDFMLAKVYDNKGNSICQILEAPGEHYFDPGDISINNFPTYMNRIFNISNRKIWIFITEPNWKTSPENKRAYVERIQKCKQYIEKKDRVIILYNKIDSLSDIKCNNIRAIINNFNNEYNGLIDIFKNTNMITSIWRKYDTKFVTFSAGSFNKLIDGGAQYSESKDKYPQNLWMAIMKCIKG